MQRFSSEHAEVLEIRSGITLVKHAVFPKPMQRKVKRKQRSETMRKLDILEMGRMDAREFREAKKIPLVMVLDDVRSMNNVGSVFRTADAFRLEAVYLCGITAQPPHPDIHKTALGAEDSVRWVYFPTALEAVEQLRSEGYKVCAVEQAEGSTMLQEAVFDASGRYALVMGNEVRGVRQEVVDACDACIEIPQYGTKHSLNVSVTAGIVMWQAFLQLRPSIEGE